MNLREGMAIIENGIQPKGFAIQFDIKNGNGFRGEYWPDDTPTELFNTVEEAWCMARKLAARTFGKFVNLRVGYWKNCGSHSTFEAVPGETIRNF